MLVLVFYFCPSSVRVVATFFGTVLFPLLHSEILIELKPDDGHIWPKHVVLILTLKKIHPLYIIRVVFLTTLPPI